MPSCSCQQCGANLKLAPSGRRKRFCSNACRQAAFRNETTAKRASSHPTKGHEKPALEPIETQYDFPLRNEELEPSQSSAHFSNELTFQKLNSVTECKSTQARADLHVLLATLWRSCAAAGWPGLGTSAAICSPLARQSKKRSGFMVVVKRERWIGFAS